MVVELEDRMGEAEYQQWAAFYEFEAWISRWQEERH